MSDFFKDQRLRLTLKQSILIPRKFHGTQVIVSGVRGHLSASIAPSDTQGRPYINLFARTEIIYYTTLKLCFQPSIHRKSDSGHQCPYINTCVIHEKSYRAKNFKSSTCGQIVIFHYVLISWYNIYCIVKRQRRRPE